MTHPSQLPSSMDHVLTSAALVGFPVLQRQKTKTYNKAFKVLCSWVSGCGLDSNSVLELGLNSKLRLSGRGRSYPLHGKFVLELWLPVATKAVLWIREMAMWL